MLVMNDAIIKMVKRIMQGIEVNEDTLMLDQIDTVGPGGEFLSSVETVQRCRQELFYDALIDRDPWAIWQENDALTMLDRIKYRLKEIVTHHKPVAITDDTRKKISHVLNAAGYSDLFTKPTIIGGEHVPPSRCGN